MTVRPHGRLSTTRSSSSAPVPADMRRAFYAADRGMQVTLVDPEPNPGGVCLYRGCIPSKALLHVAEGPQRSEARGGVGRRVRRAEDRRRQGLRAFKDKVVTQLTGGVGQVAKLRKINYIQGTRGVRRRPHARHRRRRRHDRDADVRARDHRHRLAAGDGARPVDRQPARDGLDRRARSARRPEVAARRRRRLHRPRARQRLRRARHRRSPSSR